MKLSILIPTISRHAAFLNRLLAELNRQIEPYPGQVEILIDSLETDSVGTKRNRLLQWANGEYLCYIDSDDRVSENYISLLMEGISKGVDACSLKGIITTNGKDPQYFEHSINYQYYRTSQAAEYETGGIRYERFHNHLNTIKSSIAKQIKFPEISYSEDTAFAHLLHESGLIKTEYYIPEVLYFYDYLTNKK